MSVTTRKEKQEKQEKFNKKNPAPMEQDYLSYVLNTSSKERLKRLYKHL